MKRIITIALLLLTIAPCLNAQKKELSQARTIIKSGKDIDKAITMMDKLLSEPKNSGNVQIWLTRAEAYRALYEQGNERLYLNQKQDTAELFLNARKMFIAYEQLDSVDALPDKKGKSQPKYRRKHAEYLKDYRTNLFYGGNYFLRIGRPEDAYSIMETFLGTATSPLFSSQSIGDDKNLPTAAYVTVVAGYQMKKPAMTLAYSDKALLDSLRLDNTLVYISETYRELGDQGNYILSLWKGFHNKPTSEYFFSRLFDYYNNKHEEDSAMMVVDEALRSNEGYMIALKAKSDLLLNRGDNDKCISLSKDIISRDSTVTNAYYNIGAAYINKAMKRKEGRVDAAARKKIRGYYKNALRYMEDYRKLEPDNIQMWGPALYDIYLELNMGSKFEEMERLLRRNASL